MTHSTEVKHLYRSRKGVICGVCKGVADYLGLDPLLARAITIAIFLLTGLWPIVGIYVLAAVLMPLEPVVPIRSEEEEEFYASYSRSPRLAARRLQRMHENLELRLRRLEDAVTARDFEWKKRLGENR